MNICTFDTETTGLNKPFCYNVGLVIGDTETGEILAKREWVIEQIWHNLELFNTAYYADKRPIYVDRMRARKIAMDKWGYVMQRMSRLFKEYEVQSCYAYNSPFDVRVFDFNCDWFKTQNPLETIPVYDIRGYVHAKTAWSKDFQKFCDENDRFTEGGNYSTTAETVFQYFTEKIDFEEEHTALADSEIEWEILKKCVKGGLEWDTVYKVYQSIPRNVNKKLEIVQDGESWFFEYKKMTMTKDRTKITLK